MNADTICECIKMAGGESTETNPDEMESFRKQAHAELAAIMIALNKANIDNAILRPILKELCAAATSLTTESLLNTPSRFLVHELTKQAEFAIRATPTDKVVMDREMLEKIDFVLSACPVCAAGRDKTPGSLWEHNPGCELAALLKEI